MRFASIVCLLVSLLGLSGCASYQMGEPASLPYKRIAVGKTLNYSDLPQIATPLAAALRSEILKNGSLELVPESAADAVLDIAIVEAKRDLAAVQPEDVGRARKFELTLTFEVTLKDARDPSRIYLSGKSISLTQDIYTDSGQVTAEYQATPELAQRIASLTLQELVELW